MPGVVTSLTMHINNARGDQELSTRIDAELANVEALRVFVLDERRFPGGRVNGENRHIVLAATEDFLSVEVHGGIGAVCEVDGAAVRMHVYAARGLREGYVIRAHGRSLLIDRFC